MCIVVLIAGSWFSACVLFITAGSPSVLLSQSTLTVDLRLKSIYNDIYIYTETLQRFFYGFLF